jgi:hypothetical protein
MQNFRAEPIKAKAKAVWDADSGSASAARRWRVSGWIGEGCFIEPLSGRFQNDLSMRFRK